MQTKEASENINSIPSRKLRSSKISKTEISLHPEQFDIVESSEEVKITPKKSVGKIQKSYDEKTEACNRIHGMSNNSISHNKSPDPSSSGLASKSVMLNLFTMLLLANNIPNANSHSEVSNDTKQETNPYDHDGSKSQANLHAASKKNNSKNSLKSKAKMNATTKKIAKPKVKILISRGRCGSF